MGDIASVITSHVVLLQMPIMQHRTGCSNYTHIFSANTFVLERMWIVFITANDLGYEKGREGQQSESLKSATWLMSAAIDERIKGVCAADCDETEELNKMCAEERRHISEKGESTEG